MKEPFTHYASFYGIPCYIALDESDAEGCILAGRNAFFDALLPVAAFIHNYFVAPFFVRSGFPVKIKGEIR